MKYSRKHFFLTAVVAIILFFCLPRNREWFFNLMQPPVSYADQLQYLDPVDRRMLRYGESYEYYMKLASFLSRVPKDSVVLLLPPREYVSAVGIKFSVAEPAEFYYYTGYRAVWANSPGAERANCAIVRKGNTDELVFRGINSQADIDTLLTFYRQYLPR